MHQSLNMRHAAHLQIHVAEQAEKENFHLWRTTQRCDCFEAGCCKGCIRSINLRCFGCFEAGSSRIIVFQRFSQDDSAKTCDHTDLLHGLTFVRDKTEKIHELKCLLP